MMPSQSTVDLSGSTVNGASLASAIDLVCDSGVPGATGPALIGGALSMSGGQPVTPPVRTLDVPLPWPRTASGGVHVRTRLWSRQEPVPTHRRTR
jgi:hypothetical protein